MMRLHLQFIAFLGTAAAALSKITGASLLRGPGDKVAIPSWDIQSSAQVGNDLTTLSRPGIDTSAWHHVNTSRCTLMGCLLEAGLYDDAELFFSDNLRSFDATPFAVPWLYRREFALAPAPGLHFFLQTHGITPKADIFLNGREVANKTIQSGAYAGHGFEITALVQDVNALAIRVYPTDYNYDFAIGFVDWNPYPPDNGTGVWRDVEVRQTGAVVLDPLRVVTDFDPSKLGDPAVVTIKTRIRNLEESEIVVGAATVIYGPTGGEQLLRSQQTVTLAPRESSQLAFTASLADPAIWWPSQWGDQPLYSAELTVSVDGALSDAAATTFGIRQVTSSLNAHNDTTFRINGRPFQILGAGYSADMFLRWDDDRFETQARYMLDMGLNTVRLEGKMEQPALYAAADRLGLALLPGWECCDKWEAWAYNEDLPVGPAAAWDEADYAAAAHAMRHEAAAMQPHPSVLAFLVGSDYWPDDRAAAAYADALAACDWGRPVVASASARGFPDLLGPGGMKMAGPYDWVPPGYWLDAEPAAERLGAAFGFASELGAGVGTPELASLERFLGRDDLDDLWARPDKGLYHMSTNLSSFHDRSIYNEALWRRYGAPASLPDYLLKAQMMDYEATRAQFEGYAARWGAARPATGMVYWMLNNAWPGLHWNLVDYYLRPAGAYFGAKVGCRVEHAAYDYVHEQVYLINRSLDRTGVRTIGLELLDLKGAVVFRSSISTQTEPNTSKSVFKVPVLGTIRDVVLLRLLLSDEKGEPLSRNVYWLAPDVDRLDWDNSNWFYTPVTKYADYTALEKLQPADISVSLLQSQAPCTEGRGQEAVRTVILENLADVAAVFVRLSLHDEHGADIAPVFWSDNYVTLWPHERIGLEVRYKGRETTLVRISGRNVVAAEVRWK